MFRDFLCQDAVGTQHRLRQAGTNWPLLELRGIWNSLCPSSLLVSMTSIFTGGPDIFRAAYAIEFVCQLQHQIISVWAKLLGIKVRAGRAWVVCDKGLVRALRRGRMGEEPD